VLQEKSYLAGGMFDFINGEQYKIEKGHLVFSDTDSNPVYTVRTQTIHLFAD